MFTGGSAPSNRPGLPRPRLPPSLTRRNSHAARARLRQGHGAAWTACAPDRRHEPCPRPPSTPPHSPSSRFPALSSPLALTLSSARTAVELPSLLRPVLSTPPLLSVSFLRPELRIRLAVLGRDLPAQVSLPRALNRSSVCMRPRRSSSRRRRSRFLPF